jgi:hypothetical protein
MLVILVSSRIPSAPVGAGGSGVGVGVESELLQGPSAVAAASNFASGNLLLIMVAVPYGCHRSCHCFLS